MGVHQNPDTIPAGGNGKALANPLRILVAEDAEIGLELACLMVERLGLVVDGACDGHEALQKLQAASAEGRPYALVFMDFMMPILDGIEATRRIRRAGHTADALPIIALTAVAEPAEIGRFLAAGGQAYLPKPFSIEKLGAVIEAWLPSGPIRTPKPALQQSAKLDSRYLDRKLATLVQIDAAIAFNQADPERIEEIRYLLHKLAGTAGLFGEDALASVAADFERELVEACPERALEVLESNQPGLKEAM